MAFDSPTEPSGHHLDGLRRVDYLDSGLQQDAERLPDPRWIRLYGAFGKNSDHIHPVRAWIILNIFAASGAVSAAAFFTRGGHW